MTVDQVQRLLEDSERNMPALHKRVANRLQEFKDLHDKWKNLDSSARDAIAELQVAAAQGDVALCGEKLKAINRIDREKSEVEEKIEDISGGAHDIVQPVSDILNAAIAFEPVLHWIRANFMQFPQPMRNELANKTRMLMWS